MSETSHPQPQHLATEPLEEQGPSGFRKATEVNNTKRTFDPSIADFSDTERARRLYAERGKS